MLADFSVVGRLTAALVRAFTPPWWPRAHAAGVACVAGVYGAVPIADRERTTQYLPLHFCLAIEGGVGCVKGLLVEMR